jgi:phage terminase large subunit-like protein
VVAVVEAPLGVQAPRISCVPKYVKTHGDDVLELGEKCGLVADEWQAMVIRDSLGVLKDDRFAAFEVGVNVARQNGKGVLLELRELGGVFVLEERFITHSSHMQDTSLEHMRRLIEALEEGDLIDQLKPRGGIRSANGQEALIFKSGQRIRFRTRSRGGGRGFSGECVVLDEAMFLQQSAVRALMPLMSAQQNPQLWYAGSAVDQNEMEHGVVWARVRERGHAQDTANLAYFEWSADIDNVDEVPDELDMNMVAQANPALGIRITPEYVEKEHEAMDARGFAVERLGVGDWPSTDSFTQSVIDMAIWRELEDPDSQVLDPVCLAFDVSPERRSAVAAAGRRADGLWHIEVIEAKRGTSWLADFLLEKEEKHDPLVIVADAYGPVASVIAQVEEAGLTVETVTAGEHGQACGRLVDAVADRELRHLGQPSLSSAVKGAATRPLGDAWAWSRKNSSVDISPLVAATLALSAAMERVDQAGEMVIY